MQRSSVRGRDIKPCAAQIMGINAEKCIMYLRGIGVEIDDDTADAWLDTQGTHRFLQSEKSPAKTVYLWRCMCGAMEGYSLKKRGQRYKRRKEQSNLAICEVCISGFVSMSLFYQILRDGTVRDYRPDVERIVPFDLSIFEQEAGNG